MHHLLLKFIRHFPPILGMVVLFNGCGGDLFPSPDIVVDSLDLEISKIPAAAIINNNWMVYGSRVNFNRMNGVTWGFRESKYGNSCDCNQNAYYSKYSVTVFGSNDSSILFNQTQDFGIPKIDSVFKVDTSSDLGSLSPLPRIPETTFPIFIDDGGNKVLFYANGNEHRVYYEPFGLVYCRSYSSCGTFCGYRYTTVLSQYNGMNFKYDSAIGLAKGLYNNWVQFRKTEKFTFLVRDSSKIDKVTFNDLQVWSKGDSISEKYPQPNSTEQIRIKIQGTTSSSEYIISGVLIDSLIVDAPENGVRGVYRNIETSFF